MATDIDTGEVRMELVSRIPIDEEREIIAAVLTDDYCKNGYLCEECIHCPNNLGYRYKYCAKNNFWVPQ